MPVAKATQCSGGYTVITLPEKHSAQGKNASLQMVSLLKKLRLHQFTSDSRFYLPQSSLTLLGHSFAFDC
jgi:hypothetical protein